MTLDLTFSQVCDLVKKEGKKEPKLIYEFILCRQSWQERCCGFPNEYW